MELPCMQHLSIQQKLVEPDSERPGLSGSRASLQRGLGWGRGWGGVFSITETSFLSQDSPSLVLWWCLSCLDKMNNETATSPNYKLWNTPAKDHKIWTKMKERRLRADKYFFRHEQEVDFQRSKCESPKRSAQRFLLIDTVWGTMCCPWKYRECPSRAVGQMELQERPCVVAL